MVDEKESIRPNPFKKADQAPLTPEPENEYSDTNIMARLVASCRSNKLPKGKEHRLWEAIAYNTGVSHDYARELCKRFNLNPEQRVNRE